MAEKREAHAVLLCDLSGFTEFFNSLDDDELLRFAEIYEGFLGIFFAPYKYGHRQKYLANRMGDGFLWLDFAKDAGYASLIRFVHQFLIPKCEAFIKSVKIAVADKPGLRGVRIALVGGPVVYLETRLPEEEVGKKNISRLDFLSKHINLCARLMNIEEASEYTYICDEAIYTERSRYAIHEKQDFTLLAPRQLKGIGDHKEIFGYKKKILADQTALA